MANNVTISMTVKGSEEDLWKLTQTLFEVTPYGVAFKGPFGRAGMVQICPGKEDVRGERIELTELALSFRTRNSPPPEEYFEQIAASFPNIIVEDGTIREEFCHFAYDFTINDGKWQLEDRSQDELTRSATSRPRKRGVAHPTPTQTQAKRKARR